MSSLSPVEPSNVTKTGRPARSWTLRSDVQLYKQADEHILLDKATGLRLVLGKDAANLLRALPGAPPHRVVAADLTEFLQSIDGLGLFEPATAAEAAWAQGRYILRQACDAEAERVKSTVERAVNTTRLHHDHLGRHLEGRPGWGLGDLPVLHKEDIRRYFPRGLTSDGVDLSALLRSGDLVVASTSGTTGERLQVYSDTRIPRLPSDFPRFWRLDGLPDRPVRTVVFTSPRCAGAVCGSRLEREARISFEHTLFLPSPATPFRMSDEDVRCALDELHEFEADFWLVNPIYLTALAKRADERGYRFPEVRAILYSYQFFSHCQRRAFAHYFSAPVFSLYSATELGGSQIGVSCPEGNMHVRLDQVFMELLRDGQPVQPSELGTVTVTTHHPTMPLVRYALGDLARARVAPCACDVGSLWPTFVLEGRERDAFVTGGRWITTRAVDDALKGVALAMYQLSETAPGRYRLHAIPEVGAAAWRSEAEEALVTLLAAEELVVEAVAELPIDASQKFRFTRPLSRTAGPI